jgi:hypothetical protein
VTSTKSRSGSTREEARRRVAFLAFALAVLPIIVAAARAVHSDWYPVGDNGYFSLRARDVLTEHHPLLGTWTSASLSLGEHVNNPGPLYFDLLALPARIDAATGVAVGAALVNIVFIGVSALFAFRAGGSFAATATMAAAAALGWSLGSELLFDPWQPHSMIFPFFCFVVVIWATAAGDGVALPVAVGAGSMLVQTHLSYAVLVPALGAYAVVALVLTRRAAGAASRDLWGLRRVALVSGAVAAVFWAQPVYEQLADDDGNLGRLLAHAGAGDEAVGARDAAGVLAKVVALPPWFARPSIRDALGPAAILPGNLAVFLSLGAVAAVLAVIRLTARRDRFVARGAETAAVALVVGFVAAATLPLAQFGIAGHHFRWLWPLAILVLLVTVVAVARRAGVDRGPVAHAAVLGVTAMFAALTLPSWNPQLGPSAEADGIDAARDLAADLDDVPRDGTILVETNNLPLFDPFSTVVMLELQRRGIDFVVDDDGLARQLGEERRFDGRASHRLVMAYGVDETHAIDGATRVAFAAGVDEPQRRELAELTGRTTELLSDGGVRFNARGRNARNEGSVRDLETRRAKAAAEEVVREGDVMRAVRNGWIELKGESGRLLARYAQLQNMADRYTVGVFLQPLD